MEDQVLTRIQEFSDGEPIDALAVFQGIVDAAPRDARTQQFVIDALSSEIPGIASLAAESLPALSLGTGSLSALVRQLENRSVSDGPRRRVVQEVARIGPDARLFAPNLARRVAAMFDPSDDPLETDATDDDRTLYLVYGEYGLLLEELWRPSERSGSST